MVHVTFWLLLLLTISLLGQSNAVSDQCGELQREIARIRELNRRNELLLGQCYEQRKTETHVPEAAFRSLKLAEDEFKSKPRQIEQSEADNNDLNEQLGCETMPFYIQSLHSGEYLDVEGGNEDMGTQVILYDFHGEHNQQWIYTKDMIISKLNGLALDISEARENGQIIMWPQNGGDNQKWYFDDDLTIRSKLGFVLDVKYGATGESSALVATAKNGQDNQKFRVVLIKE